MRFSDNSSAAFKPLGSGCSVRINEKDPRKTAKAVYLKKSDLGSLPVHSLRLLGSGYPICLPDGRTVKAEKVGAVTKYRVL